MSDLTLTLDTVMNQYLKFTLWLAGIVAFVLVVLPTLLMMTFGLGFMHVFNTTFSQLH